MKPLTAAISILSACVTSALHGQVTLNEDFESSTAGSSTPPAGWSLVQTAGTATYTSSSAGSGSDGTGGDLGLAGQVSATAGVGGNGLPGAYLVNTAAIDLSNAVSGTFDFLMPNEAGFDDVGFIIGDVADGITGTSAGELLYLRITEGNPNARAGIIQDGTSDGTNDILASNGAVISDDTWYRVTVSWNPTSGTTGDFSITINDFSGDLLTVGVTGFVFDSAEGQIGFGSINDTIRFDNVDFIYTPVGPDDDPPTLVGITDDRGGASVEADVPVTYTVEFSEDIDEGTVSAADFANAGSANVNFGAITETSPGIFTVLVTPTTAGTLQLSVPTHADIRDPAGNLLDSDPVLLDDTTITVTAPAVLGLDLVSADPAANVDLLLTGPQSSPYFVFRSSDLEGPIYRKRWEQRFAGVFPSSVSEIPLQEPMPAEDRSFYLASDAVPKARIMCVGDSITEGGSTYFVYRPALNSQLIAAGYRFEFVGSKTNTRQGVTLKHEGYAGKNASQVASLLSGTFPDNIADIVLIHAGHNYFADVQGEVSILNEVEAATRSMITTARTHNPDVIILLAQVITSSKLPKYSYIPALNIRLAEVATDLDSPEQPVIIVNQAEGWDPVADTVADQVHPTEVGATKMADKWLATLAPLLE